MSSSAIEKARPRLDAVECAYAAIDPLFRDSPLLEVPAWDELAGARVACKVETLNPIRSFKGRGALWLVAEMVARGEGLPLCAASAGNFGQGLAWAARAAGLPLTIFAAESANPLKVAKMREFGAEVILGGRDFDAAKELARDHAAATGSRFVEDGAEREVAEGAATLALELLRQGPAPDALYVPLGNGALLIGVGIWLRRQAPQTRLIGVVAAGAPAMALSFEAGRPISTDAAITAADGIGVRVPVPAAVALLPECVDEIVQIDEKAIFGAMCRLEGDLGLVVEPAGAAGLAAVLADAGRWRGGRVATVLCGGNVAPEMRRSNA